MSLTLRTDTLEVEALQLEVTYWKNRSEMFELMYKELPKNKSVNHEQEELELKAAYLNAPWNQEAYIKPTEMSIERPTKFYNLQKIETQNIQKMVINHFDESWKSWFEVSDFKSLKELRIDCSLYNEDEIKHYDQEDYLVSGNMQCIFTGMSNLKQIVLRTDAPHFDRIRPPFKLETAEMEYYFTSLLPKTLRDLKISKHIYSSQLEEIYKGFKNLQKFVASVSIEHVSNLKVNESIVNLEIDLKKSEYGNGSKDISDENFLEEVLKATPSLKILTLYVKITNSILNFLVHNMKNLKQLICRGGIDKDIQELYENMKKDEPEINKKIAIKVEWTRTWTEEYKPKAGLHM